MVTALACLRLVSMELSAGRKTQRAKVCRVNALLACAASPQLRNAWKAAAGLRAVCGWGATMRYSPTVRCGALELLLFSKD